MASTLTVLTWNMCGVERWNGCAGTGSAAEKAAELVRTVRTQRADAVLLQEACERTAGRLREERNGESTRWQVAFEPYRTPTGAAVRCTRGSGRAGIALAVRGRLEDVRYVAAPQPHDDIRRGVLCAARAGDGVELCTAHLTPHFAATPGPDPRPAQLAALAAAADASPAAVFGGDLNTLPPKAEGGVMPSGVWPSTLYDRYRECGQHGRRGGPATPTHAGGFKIDYLFTDLRRQGCRTLGTAFSDHAMLLMRVEPHHV
ncbi:endonuclease/exonuclease/phosphatase family protein [Streptomyces polyrhachis]|uniref:Endonuclease/exonuclease/phosphatase family protein n=1 Tax=Streptomyces polyrhachis TaxID=1282885 RepID=A0ABW2GF67_9ACTN